MNGRKPRILPDESRQDHDEGALKPVNPHRKAVWFKHLNDLEDLYDCVKGMDCERVQLASGPCHGRIVKFDLGRSTVHFGDYEAPFRITAGTWCMKDLTFGISFADTPWNKANGHELTREKLLIFPEASDHEMPFKGRNTWLGIVVSYEEINRFAQTLERQEVVPFGSHCRAIVPTQDSLSRVRRACREFLNMGLTNSAWLDPAGNRKKIHEQLMHLLVRAILSSEEIGQIVREPQRIKSQHIFKTAEEYIQSHYMENVSIGDLCRITNSPERSLHRAFQENLGVAPRQFLKGYRLMRARRLLRRSSRESTTVSAIAYDSGFWHLGRFSVSYKQLFGESPRETLYRD